MNKTFLTSTALTLSMLGGNAWAAPDVSLSVGQGRSIDVSIDADGQPFAVFPSGNDVWFAFGHRENAGMTVPKDVRDIFSLNSQKLLNVDAGVGVLLSFKELPKLNFKVKNAPNFADVPVSLMALKDGMRLSGTPAQILKVTHPDTGEGYTVIPMDKLEKTENLNRTYGDIRISPAYAGVVVDYKNKPMTSVYAGGEFVLSYDRKKAAELAKLNPLGNPKPEAPQTPKDEDVAVEKTESLAALPSPVVLEKGESKIILQKPVEAAKPVDAPKVESVPEAENVAKAETPQPVSNAAAQGLASIAAAKEALKSPGLDKIFNNQQGVDKVALDEHKIAEIQQAPQPEKQKQVVKQNPATAFERDFKRDDAAFGRALEEISKARADIEGSYVPKVNEEAESVQQIKPLGLSGADAQDEFSSFFGNDVAQGFGEPQVQNTPIEEVELREEVDSGELTDEQLALMAQDVLGDYVDLESFKEKQEELGVELEEETFFNKLDLIDVAEDDALFKMYGDGTNVAYNTFYKKFLEALANTTDKQKKDLYRLGLAKLNIAYERPFETLMILDNMPKDEETGKPLHEGARLVAAVANLIVNRPDDAVYYMEPKVEQFPEDYNVWQAVFLESQDKDVEAVNLFEKHLEHVEDYPTYLVQEVYLSYGRLLLRLERLSDLKALMQKLTKRMPRGQLPPEGLLMLARAHILERNDDLAEAILAQAAASDNPNVAFMAQYEFVDFLMSRGDLGLNQAISHLENLRYLWRGGKVEADILEKLGRMYLARGSHRLGLERLKQHNIYFPNNPQVNVTTDIMSAAFSDLYMDGNIESDHDTLELLGIYYDFRELTPPGEEGDKLIGSISERLRTLQLFDRAIKLLESQLKYRVKEDDARAKMGMRLADLYLLNRQYKEGFNVLNRTEGKDISAEVQDGRSVVYAKLLMGTRKYEEALKVLQGVKHPEVPDLEGRIAWVLETYPNVIKHLEPAYDNPEKLPKQWGSNERVALTELAVAYNMTGRLRDLESLKNRYMKEIEKDENMKNVFDFLMMDQGSSVVILPENQDTLWPKLTDAMQHYYTFVDFYKEFREDRNESREEKELFNRRMRQISAPARL